MWTFAELHVSWTFAWDQQLTLAELLLCSLGVGSLRVKGLAQHRLGHSMHYISFTSGAFHPIRKHRWLCRDHLPVSTSDHFLQFTRCLIVAYMKPYKTTCPERFKFLPTVWTSRSIHKHCPFVWPSLVLPRGNRNISKAGFGREFPEKWVGGYLAV